MLDRSIPTREALVHSILISEVKDMKSDVLRALKGSFSKKKLWTLFAGSILTIFKKERKKNCIDFEFLPATFPLLGLKKNWNLLVIPFFLSLHIHSYLLILLKYKNQILLIFKFLMSFQLTSLRYLKAHQLRSNTFLLKILRRNFSLRQDLEDPVFEVWTLWSCN
jgi:hypothetical protein